MPLIRIRSAGVRHERVSISACSQRRDEFVDQRRNLVASVLVWPDPAVGQGDFEPRALVAGSMPYVEDNVSQRTFLDDLADGFIGVRVAAFADQHRGFPPWNVGHQFLIIEL